MPEVFMNAEPLDLGVEWNAHCLSKPGAPSN